MIVSECGDESMNKEKNKTDFDFRLFGNAIKNARNHAGLTIEALAEKTGFTPRYIAAIENERKSASVKTLFTIVTFLNISVDELIYPDSLNKNAQRRYIDSMLDQLDDKSLDIVEGVLQTLIQVNKPNK